MCVRRGYSINWRSLLRQSKSSLRANPPDQRSDHPRKSPPSDQPPPILTITLTRPPPLSPSSRINKPTSIAHAGRREVEDLLLRDMHVTGLGLARGLLGRGGRKRERKEVKGLLPI